MKPVLRISLLTILFLLLVVSLSPFAGPAVLAGAKGINQPTAPLLDENFNSGTLPANWQANGTPGWAFGTTLRQNNSGGDGLFAIADSDVAGTVPMDTELLTPVLDLSGHTAVKLIFKTYFEAYEASTADVDVSINGGSTWTNIWRKTSVNYQGTVQLDVPQAIGQSNVRFRFHYYNANYSWYWLIDDVLVPDAATTSTPSAPTTLTAQVPASTYNVALTWVDTSNNETNFIIERSANGSSGWAEVGRVAGNTTAYTQPNVTCNTPVFYRVKAVNGGLQSPYSNTANLTTPACQSVISTINENFDASTNLPAGWTVVNTAGTWLFNQPNLIGTTGNVAQSGAGTKSQLRTPILNFTGINAVLLTFKTNIKIYAGQTLAQNGDVDISFDGGATWTNIWRKTAEFKGQVALDISPYVANKSNVMLRFTAVLPYGGSFWQIDDVVIGPLAVPNTPTNLSTTLTGASEVLLAWGSGGDAAKYRLERSADNGTTWTQIADITDGATTYVDSSTASFTSYQYRVQAYNAAGQSAFSPATANVATLDKSVRYVDVTISLYAGAPINTPAERAKYENIIGYFADTIYEMSNGAHRLRKVTFYRDAQNWDNVNVQWTPSCHPNATGSGILRVGQGARVAFCDYFNPVDFLANDNGQRGGGATLGHEWGHYFYGVGDEYATGPNDGPISATRGNDISSTNSVMANQWAGWNDNRWLNFSTTPNGFSLVTAQGRVYGASSWETIARPKSQDPQNGFAGSRPYWPELTAVAPAPGQLPRQDLPSVNARATLQIVWQPGFAAQNRSGDTVLGVANGIVREIVIDRSLLMADSTYLDEAKAAVTTLIAQMPLGDTVGVIAYDDTPTVVATLTDVITETTKDSLILAVNGITAGNADAAGGDALQMAFNELTAAPVPTDTTRIVYLITAGATTTGTQAITLVPDYQTAGIPLYISGFAPTQGNESEMRQLADLTGGKYNTVYTAAELQKVFQLADEDTSPTQDVTLISNEGYLEAGVVFTDVITVDDTLAQVDFEVTYYGEPMSATVSFTAPNGTEFPLDPAADCETFNSGADAQTTCYISFIYAEGDWGISLESAEGVYVIYQASGFAQDQSTYDVVLRTKNGDVVEYPQPIVVEAIVSRDYPIGGLAVSGWVYEPNGEAIYVDLDDDGVAPDLIADDGIYSAYADYTQDGKHWIGVQISNRYGTAFYTDAGVSDSTGETSSMLRAIDIGPFQRYTEEQVVVTGWQEDDHTQWPDDPNWPPTSLSLDNVPVAGRIDFANDDDVFAITVPVDYSGTLGVRINGLGLGMDPYVNIYAADYSWQFQRYLDYVPNNNEALFVPIDVKPGETFYVEVWHYDEQLTGTYNISAGPYLWSDPIPQPRPTYRLLLPIVTTP